jgi:uncharacterized protein (TIGR03435 family)
MSAAAIVLNTLTLVTLAVLPVRIGEPSRPAILRAPQARHAFEVASVKPRGKFVGPAEIGVSLLPGGRVVAVNAPIYLLIEVAFGVSGKQIDMKNADRDLLEEVFDIEAKAGPDGLPDSASPDASNARLRLMLQTLLAERFKLKLHKETRELSAYALVVAPGGHKLKPAPAGRVCPAGTRCGILPGGPASGLKGLDVEFSKLVEVLTIFGERHVIDRTGLTGRFDIELSPWSRSLSRPAALNEPGDDPNDPTIFAVLQRTLGLRLESIKAPLEILVVDHIERPSPNVVAGPNFDSGRRER